MRYFFLIFSVLSYFNHALAQGRYALVIGNGAYPQKQAWVNDLAPLPTPHHDAEDMARLLKEAGFRLLDSNGANKPVINASKIEMDSAVDQLIARLQQAPNSAVIFYYSGHGVYLHEESRPKESANYLLPVGVNFTAQDAAKFKGFGVNAHNIKDRIESSSAKAKLMILDTCREKLELKQSKGFAGGGEFRPMNPLNGMMVVHATLHNAVAWTEADERNSDFTRYLLPALRQGKGENIMLSIGQAIERFGTETAHLPNEQRQQPHAEGLLFGAFCLQGCGGLRDNIPSRDVIPAGVTRINRYLVSNDGTAKDTVTGLTWMRCLVGQEWDGETCVGGAKRFNSEQARQQTATFAGFSDWRMPTIEELRTLVYCSDGKPDYFNPDPVNDPDNFYCWGKDFEHPTLVKGVFPNNPVNFVWSGSSNANSSSRAWYVFFYDGHGGGLNHGGNLEVRLVRSGQ